MSKLRMSTPRTADCPEFVMLLRGQGLDCIGVSESEHDPEHEDRPWYEGEMLVVAVHCGPCVGVYRAPPPPRRARADVASEKASTS